jgi:F-type H+-transporting ATPase subunit delta
MAQISNEYAAALFMLARENGTEHPIAAALDQILAVWQENPAYKELLISPAIPLQERRELIAQAFSDMPEHVVSFMQLLCERGRIDSFPECAEEYRRLLRNYESVAVAKVTSAVPLTQAEAEALKEKLQQQGKRTVLLECTVDSSLIGGVVVEMDGLLIDGSLRHRLQQVKEVIKQ